MRQYRALKWAGYVALTLVLSVVLAVGALLLFGGNWLRGPVERAVLERTGRALDIAGDVRFGLGWPLLRVHAGKIRFANPAWAKQSPDMLRADEIELGLALPHLLLGRLGIDELTLRRADVSLEQSADGRKNWLLDLEQQDENARIAIGRLALHDSHVGYDESAKKTRIRTRVASIAGSGNIAFSADGQYLGMPLTARGSGGSLLGLRDESKPYPFKMDATIGPTKVMAEGSITGLSKISALDLKIAISGNSLAELYPLIGIALPETPGYRTSGRLEHKAKAWRYEKFAARVGDSDFAGTLTVDAAGKRPFLAGELVFGRLNLADLGPVIGTSRTSAPGTGKEAAPAQATPARRVLPEVPFNADRWSSVDADIKLSADKLVRPHELPLEQFVTHLKLRDSVLVLDPLDFGIAGGRLTSAVTLDGRQDPIQAKAKLRVDKIALDRLIPGFDKSMMDPGRVEGDIDLAGKGNSVSQMLGTASGSAALLVAGGHVSRLAMEMVGLHLPEILATKARGDEPVPIRCGAAEFKVIDGVMHTEMLIFDTAITTLQGRGDVDLAREGLDMTIVPRTKETSLLSLNSPIRIRGTFSKPSVQLDTGRIAARGLGAAALGVANPLLLLLPLIDRGPGKDSDCGRLFAAASEARRAAPAPSR